MTASGWFAGTGAVEALGAGELVFFLLQPVTGAIVNNIRPNPINVSPKRREKKVLKALLFFIFSIEVTGLIDIEFG